jgi:quercetin 2,3-dioxygenase
MNTPKPMLVREVARIDDPQFVSGQVAGHRARRLIDAPDAAFADPFVLVAADWTPQGIFPFHHIAASDRALTDPCEMEKFP